VGITTGILEHVGLLAASEHSRWLALSAARREGGARLSPGRDKQASRELMAALPPMRIHAFDPAADKALCGWREVTRLNIPWAEVDVGYRCAQCRSLSE
jgi:hypothetical protein